MASSPTSPFDKIPLEMRLNICSYLTPREILTFRSVCRSSHFSVLPLLPSIPFQRCTLSDDSSKTVLASTLPNIDEIVVKDLSSGKLGLSSSRGSYLIASAKKLTIGPRVHPETLKNVLRYSMDVETLAFQDAEPSSASVLLELDRKWHERISRLEIILNCTAFIAPSDVTFLQLLSSSHRSRRLVNLKFLRVSLASRRSPDSAFILPHDEMRRFFSLYCSVHRLALIHKASLSSIAFDFSGLIPYNKNWSPSEPKDKSAFLKLRRDLMDLTQLEEITLQRFSAEGAGYFNLSLALLLSQSHLSVLSFTTVPSAFESGIEFIMTKNRHTLKSLFFDRPRFLPSWLHDLTSLEVLKVRTYFWVRPLRFPQTLTELTLEVETALLPSDAIPVHDWICDNLKNLQRIFLSLKMRKEYTGAYPDVKSFKRLFGMPKLENAKVALFSEDKCSSRSVGTVLERRNELKSLCEGVTGLKTKLSETNLHCCVGKKDHRHSNCQRFILEVEIDRKHFYGLKEEPQDFEDLEGMEVD